MSVQDLVSATGANRFAIYEKFGGKEGLFYDTLDYYHQVIIRQQLLGPMYRDDASLETLLGMLGIVRDINRDGSRRSGCLIVNANIELGGRDQRVAVAAESVIASFRDATAHALVRARERGSLREDPPPREGAEHVAIQIQAFFALAYISREAADRLISGLIEEVRRWGASRHGGTA